MDTKTLDERIRENAREELRKNIESAFKPVHGLLSFFEWLKFPELRFGSAPGEVHGQHLIDALKDGLFEKLGSDAEEKAVADFMAKVDGLQSEIESLRESIGERI